MFGGWRPGLFRGSGVVLGSCNTADVRVSYLSAQELSTKGVLHHEEQSSTTVNWTREEQRMGCKLVAFDNT